MTIRFPHPVTLTLESGIDPADEHSRHFAAGETAELQGVVSQGDGWTDLHFPNLPGFTRGWRACGVHESVYEVIAPVQA